MDMTLDRAELETNSQSSEQDVGRLAIRFVTHAPPPSAHLRGLVDDRLHFLLCSLDALVWRSPIFTMLVDGLAVGYRRKDCSIAGALARRAG